ncbi:MAG: ATP synthase subunit I [Nitrospirae bacterium]|nr:ATP synthase subunit I [Nitrospirota bacterium]
MDILKGVFKKSIFLVITAAIISAFFEQKKLPLGIIAGGIFGILNLRGVVRSVEGFVGSESPSAGTVIFNMIRLLMLFAAIFLLVWYKIINIIGLLIGFTIIFILIIVEGIKAAKSK